MEGRDEWHHDRGWDAEAVSIGSGDHGAGARRLDGWLFQSPAKAGWGVRRRASPSSPFRRVGGDLGDRRDEAGKCLPEGMAGR